MRDVDLAGAIFSPCRRWRYKLWRKFNASKDPSMVCFVMLNPSKADEVQMDPTVSRCAKRAQLLGYDGLIVTNIFALVSTDPRALIGAVDPVGPENDEHILSTAVESALVICAWGRNGLLNDRGMAVVRMLRRAEVKLHALRISEKTGMPEHPLYQSYSVMPIPFGEAA